MYDDDVLWPTAEGSHCFLLRLYQLVYMYIENENIGCLMPEATAYWYVYNSIQVVRVLRVDMTVLSLFCTSMRQMRK